MKRLTEVLTAALLMAAMTMATGCSKEEIGNMEEGNRSEQTQQDYFEEPILDFSLTLEQLKARETHELTHESEWDYTEMGGAAGCTRPVDGGV